MEKELEQFYKKFEIPKKEPCKYNLGCGHAKPCCPRDKVYPPITDAILLGLINIVAKEIESTNPKSILEFRTDIDITIQILNGAIQLAPQIKPQVQELFKGE